MELIHTATLLHDDVGGSDPTCRCVVPPANAEFGNAASVLVSDFFTSRALQVMVGTGRPRVPELV